MVIISHPLKEQGIEADKSYITPLTLGLHTIVLLWEQPPPGGQGWAIVWEFVRGCQGADGCLSSIQPGYT